MRAGAANVTTAVEYAKRRPSAGVFAFGDRCRLPGVVFLSGGQADEDATAHLDAMNRLGNLPWPLSFSYGRAMQQAALKLWSQDMVGNYAKAQQTVFERAKANGLAALGQWGG